jgi:hypothetical protein
MCIRDRYTSKKFPSCNVVCLGAEDKRVGNLTSYKAGTVSDRDMNDILLNASVVILPSFYEGFGFGFMHAAALGKPIVARNISATKEIIESYSNIEGVYLYDEIRDLEKIIPDAISFGKSIIHDKDACDWGQWANGFSDLISTSINGDAIYSLLVNRIRDGDRLRENFQLNQLLNNHHHESPVNINSLHNQNNTETVSINDLLRLDGESFICEAYRKILWRECDSSGLKHYISELNRGLSKTEILKNISRSKESKSIISELKQSRFF